MRKSRPNPYRSYRPNNSKSYRGRPKPHVQPKSKRKNRNVSNNPPNNQRQAQAGKRRDKDKDKPHKPPKTSQNQELLNLKMRILNRKKNSQKAKQQPAAKPQARREKTASSCKKPDQKTPGTRQSAKSNGNSDPKMTDRPDDTPKIGETNDNDKSKRGFTEKVPDEQNTNDKQKNDTPASKSQSDGQDQQKAASEVIAEKKEPRGNTVWTQPGEPKITIPLADQSAKLPQPAKTDTTPDSEPARIEAAGKDPDQAQPQVPETKNGEAESDKRSKDTRQSLVLRIEQAEKSPRDHANAEQSGPDLEPAKQHKIPGECDNTLLKKRSTFATAGTLEGQQRSIKPKKLAAVRDFQSTPKHCCSRSNGRCRSMMKCRSESQNVGNQNLPSCGIAAISG